MISRYLKLVSPFILLMVLVGIAYWPACQGGFVWDDDDYVTDNWVLRSADGLKRAWLEPGVTPQYYPLVFTSFWLEYQVWGLNPAGYHWVNVILHGLNSCLLFLVLRRLGVPGAWLAAASFGLHPVHVESVAWVTERKNVLSGFFYLMALLAFLRFSPSEQTESETSGRWGWYGLGLVLFVAALCSKTVTCSLPAVLVLLWWWKHGRFTWREIIALTPLFAIGLVLALNTAQLERHHVGARGEDFDFSPVERCLIAGRALWFYAGKLIWPHPLMFNYPRWHIDAAVPWQYVFPTAALLVLGGLFTWRHRLGKGPLVACLIFAGTLVPALGFFNVYPMVFSFVADHFQYLASAALIALAVGTARHILHAQRDVDLFLAGSVLLTLGYLTWQQGRIYHDVETLWRDTLQKNPDSWLARYNLGTKQMLDGHEEQSLEHFQRVVTIKPNYAMAYSNWGIALAKQGKFDLAREKIEKSYQLEKTDPDIPCNMGTLLYLQNNYRESLRFYDEALSLDPYHARSHYQMGMALLQLERSKEAVSHLQKAVQYQPDAEAHRQGLAKARKQAEF